ncbi:MAG: GNAT family N-acetyltransferase [Candidatus Eremiobacteraeota bacterium]|nr:GNAT family N-acetyltransferase [Candidatus Eremiobacteraeota bacterium]
MIIRRAQPEEAEALTQLALRSKRSWGYDDAFMTAIKDDMIVRPKYLKDEHGIVAQNGADVAGYAILRVDDDESYLRDLFVEPAFMRIGFGAALFHHMISFARAQKAKRLWLHSDPHAIGFYKRYGLRVIAEEPSTLIPKRKVPVMLISLTPR